MKELAIQGGSPVRDKSNFFPAANTINEEEKSAVLRVLDSGILSKYQGVWNPDFYGGSEVQAFEREWAEYFNVKHAIALNSASSGLIIALGAIGIEPGDEVIVTPYSMVISASAPLFYGAVPVFVDLEPEYFCLDPQLIEAAITPRTKAIIVVDIFGQPYDVDVINAIAKKHNIAVVEDAAQAPGALYKGRLAGTLADIGIYSLNYHKHIHTGEGGVAVTNDDKLAERLQLLRNHAEAVVEGKGVSNLSNMVANNLRFTEIQAAIGREQLKKLDYLISERQKNCLYISERCQDMNGFRPALTRPQSTNAHYLHTFIYDENAIGIPRAKFVDAVKAELPARKLRESEGALVSGGYVKPIYLMPLFAKQIAFGSKGYPFKSPLYKGKTHYELGMCPVVERLFASDLILHDMMRPGMTNKDLDDVVKAFHKVYKNREELL